MNYAVVQFGEDIKLRKFSTMDEVQDALIVLQQRDILFLVAKRNEEAGVWSLLEMALLEGLKT